MHIRRRNNNNYCNWYINLDGRLRQRNDNFYAIQMKMKFDYANRLWLLFSVPYSRTTYTQSYSRVTERRYALIPQIEFVLCRLSSIRFTSSTLTSVRCDFNVWTILMMPNSHIFFFNVIHIGRTILCEWKWVDMFCVWRQNEMTSAVAMM